MGCYYGGQFPEVLLSIPLVNPFREMPKCLKYPLASVQVKPKRYHVVIEISSNRQVDFVDRKQSWAGCFPPSRVLVLS